MHPKSTQLARQSEHIPEPEKIRVAGSSTEIKRVNLEKVIWKENLQGFIMKYNIMNEQNKKEKKEENIN